MKKAVAIIGVAAMLLSLAACAKAPVDSDQDAQTTTTVNTTVSDVDSTTVTTTQSPNTTTGSKKPTGTTTTATTTSTTASRTTKLQIRYYNKYADFIEERGGLPNTSYKITQDKELSVAFMGGSVSVGQGGTNDGWRGGLITQLRLTYEAIFKSINATLGGNGSRYGVYITDQLVAEKKPDLVFIEYAVNNAYDGVTDAETLWVHYETMIHKIRAANPYADIVLVYVSDSAHRSQAIIPELEKIADKYQLVSVNLYEALMRGMGSQTNWNRYYSDGVHPNDNGYMVMTNVMLGLFEYALRTPSATYQKSTTPAPKGRIQSEAKAALTSALTTVPDGWEKVQTVSWAKSRYGGCIQTKTTGKPITVTFKGTDFGVFVDYAPDAGILEYSIDGGAYQTLNCHLDYTNPKAMILMENAANTQHTITIKLGSGSRMAIAAFLLNGTVQSVQ